MSIPQSPSPADGTKAIPWLWLGVIVLAAAAVRGVVWGLTLIIGADGPAFLEIAALFGKGEVEAAIGHPTHYHPFYPALVSLASRWIESPQCAGEAVSFFFGVLTPIPLFFLARRFTGDAVALAAATILAAHPIAARLSVDLKSDSTYAFLFVCSVWLSWETITGRHKAIAFLAGLSAGLAYLTRPEGLGVILVAAPWLLLEKKEGWGKRLALAGTLLLGALLPATPYAAEISRQAGEFRITRKKSLSDFIGAAE
ncbi:MAG: glycosyltransferase family 39 protein, partial [Planctomycetota bacterium]|nr:glycosyltransferase family 39 protein [Planctomycetota bacterium]